MCGTLDRRMPQVPSKSKKKSYFCCCCYCLVANSCLILCSPMACSSLGFSAHGIAQARILQWVAVSYSRWSSGPRNRTPAGGFFIPEPRGKLKLCFKSTFGSTSIWPQGGDRATEYDTITATIPITAQSRQSSQLWARIDHRLLWKSNSWEQNMITVFL